MKVKTRKKSSKGLLETIFTTTLIAAVVIFGLIYVFKPQITTDDLSNFFYKIPGLKPLPDKTTLPPTGPSLTKTVSKDDLKQSGKDLDNLDIDNFDSSINQNDQ